MSIGYGLSGGGGIQTGGGRTPAMTPQASMGAGLGGGIQNGGRAPIHTQYDFNPNGPGGGSTPQGPGVPTPRSPGSGSADPLTNSVSNQVTNAGGYDNAAGSLYIHGEDYAQQANNAGLALYGQQGPTINTAKGDQAGQLYGQSYGAQRDAANMMQQTAQGQGAGIRSIDQANAAQQGAIGRQFNAQLGQQLNASMAASNSARGGGPGLAAAQAGASQNMGQQMSQSAQGAGSAMAQANAAAMQARSGLIGQAQSQYGQQTLGMGSQAQQEQQEQYKLAGAQAGLQAQQGALNQQGLLAEQGMGLSALQSEQQAASNAYANQLGLSGTTQQIAANQTSSEVGAGLAAGGAILSLL